MRAARYIAERGRVYAILEDGTKEEAGTALSADGRELERHDRALTEARRQRAAADRLEYLRGQIRAERISYGELAELQGMAGDIEPGDVELLEWAGVPEHEEDA